MTKVLFVTERWCDGIPERGISNTEHNLFGSLESSGLAEFECLFSDEYLLSYGRTIDNYLLNYCQIYQPDLVVVSPLIDMQMIHPTTVQPETLGKLDVPVATIWWDTVFVKRMGFVDMFAPHVDLCVIIDRHDYVTEHPTKCTHLWCPQDIEIFNNPKKERDLDIVFLGRVDGHPKRKSAINMLKSCGVKLEIGGGQRTSDLEITKYADMFQRAKIVLNFSWAINTVPTIVPYQMKARIFEATLCGAMLLDSENPYTGNWFETGVDYISFANDKELLTEVDRYLEDDNKRLEVAYRGCKKASDNYNAVKFWSKIFEKTGVHGYQRAADCI
jgi:hypothetical protein